MYVFLATCFTTHPPYSGAPFSWCHASAEVAFLSKSAGVDLAFHKDSMLLYNLPYLLIDRVALHLKALAGIRIGFASRWLISLAALRGTQLLPPKMMTEDSNARLPA